MPSVPVDLTKVDYKTLIRKNVLGGGPFIGQRYQRGGSQRGAGLGGVLTAVASVLPQFLKSFIGQKIVHTGSQVINDVIAGDSLGKSLKKHGRTAVREMTGLGPRKSINKSVKVMKPHFVKKISRRSKYLNA